MRIQFCGADRTVTGSSHLIEVNGLRVFLDMGMYQGPRDEARADQCLPARRCEVGRCDRALTRAPGPLRQAADCRAGGVQGAGLLHAGDRGGGAIVLNDAAKIQTGRHRPSQPAGRRRATPPLSALYGPNDIPNVTRLFNASPTSRRPIWARASRSPSSTPGTSSVRLISCWSGSRRASRISCCSPLMSDAMGHRILCDPMNCLDRWTG